MNAAALPKKFWNLYHDFSDEARKLDICPALPKIRGVWFPRGIRMDHRAAQKNRVPCYTFDRVVNSF